VKTVPSIDGSGTVPLCGSKNPVLGVFLHHCGGIASVHQPNGKRSHTRYLICGNCGTDQCGGKPYQAKIKANTYPTIEALQAAGNAVSAVNESLEEVTTNLHEGLAKELTEKLEGIKPMDTAPHAVSTVNLSSEFVSPVLSETTVEKTPLPKPTVIPVQASNSAVSTVKSIPSSVERQQNSEIPPLKKDSKPMRMGFAAIIGGAIGVFLAAVA